MFSIQGSPSRGFEAHKKLGHRELKAQIQARGPKVINVLYKLNSKNVILFPVCSIAWHMVHSIWYRALAIEHAKSKVQARCPKGVNIIYKFNSKNSCYAPGSGPPMKII